MDGIDGIAGFQAFIAGVAWCIFGTILSAPWLAFLGTIIAAGAIGFLSLNWPPAKIFMGDAGSTVLGYCFAVLPLVAVIESKSGARFEPLLLAGALVVWPFLADGAFTILRRLKNRENILKAHRSHMYQRLVIAGRSHQIVTCVYGALAIMGAVLAWRIVIGAPFAAMTALFVVGVAFAALWIWVVREERRAGAARRVAVI